MTEARPVNWNNSNYIRQMKNPHDLPQVLYTGKAFYTTRRIKGLFTELQQNVSFYILSL